MARKSPTPIKDFFAAIAFLIGLGVAMFVLWLVAFVILAVLIFVGLALFTNWGFLSKLGTSLLSSFIALKVLGFLFAALDLVPESWYDKTKEPRDCPHCGQTLRTALAKQCMHCGADWHHEIRPS